MPILGEYPTSVFMPTFQFKVIVDGLGDPMEGFTKISEIKMEIETIEFRSGMDAGIRKSMGRLKCADVTLERPFQGLDEFYGWFETCTREHDKRTVWIEFLRPNGIDVVRKYALYGAWPKEWVLPAMDAGGSNIGIEKITLAVERSLQLE
jgi:phage tail-like protein